MKSDHWKKIVTTLAALPVMALLAYGLTKDPKAIPSPLVGKEAPPFRLTLFNGEEVALGDFRGKVVVINFWASWCYPACWDEAPRLERAWNEYRDRGVVILGINYQDRETDARDFIQRFRKSFSNGPDTTGRIGMEYGVYGVPETFFVDRNGKMSHKHVGEIDWKTLAEEIAVLIAPSAVSQKELTKSQVYSRRETKPPLSLTLFVGKTALAYQVAKEIPEILDQLYCYCECDKHAGHVSLLSCYTDSHAAT